MKKTAALAITLGMAFAATPTAHAAGDWIAMAISDSTGQIKFVSGGATGAAAEKSVMDACRKNVSDCRMLASGEGGCVALATNAAGNQYVGGWGPSRPEAEAAAAAKGGGAVKADHTHCVGDPSS
jgi:hypothetical protein